MLRMLQALSVFLCAGCLCLSSLAHGIPKPKHGGIVDVGGEVTFELVRKGSTVTVHVEDHGKPVNTRGAVAELLLGSETGRRLGTFKDLGAGGLSGSFAPFRRGDRLFVRVTFSDGSISVGEILVP